MCARPGGSDSRAERSKLDPDRAYVLYWMTAFRRLTANFALERAVELARQTGRPLLIFEPLRADYPFASDRLHRFVLDGMAEHSHALADTPVTYFPYVEPSPAAARGLLQDLASRAVAVVADDYPCFFLPRMVEAQRGRWMRASNAWTATAWCRSARRRARSPRRCRFALICNAACRRRLRRGRLR